MDIRVLYEDNHLLVVEKPANVPVQADASGDEDLLTACKGYIKEKYQKPGEVYLGLVHRLDRPVGGVMVFARTSKAAARLTEQFSAHRARKRYAAAVEGDAPAEGRLTDFLMKNESTNTTAVVAVGTPGAKQAKLSFRTLAREKGLSLLDVDLQTGRPHQIRVQLSHAGYPIHGDQRYNPAAKVGEQIRLWAYALTIAHPTLKEEMTFYALPPFPEFPTAVKYLPAFRAASAVYEDDDMLVVNKPSGLLSVPGRIEEYSVETVMHQRYPGSFIAHRLDMGTSGLLIVAKHIEAYHTLQQQFIHHEVKKKYVALLERAGQGSGTISLPLRPDPMNRPRQVADREHGKRAVTRYEFISERLVALWPEKGRTHQLRIHCAHPDGLNNPIVGDELYGTKGQRLCLHAAEIWFKHPITGQAMHFEITPDFV